MRNRGTLLARCAFLFIMKQDPKITKAIQDWLNTPEESRDIAAGADLMLSLNRNRALYNSIMLKPKKLLPKLVHELKKFLRLRLDNMATADVVRMEQRVMPAVAMIVEKPIVIDQDDELPEGKVAKGRRKDHDSLPPEIRELWDSNEARYRRIVVLFNELKSMGNLPPCDRYEKLVILDDLDKTYRRNLEMYDAYTPGMEVRADSTAAVNAARKTLSKYRKKVAEMPSDSPKRKLALDKIQTCVNTIVGCHAGLADDTRIELEALGIKFN